MALLVNIILCLFIPFGVMILLCAIITTKDKPIFYGLWIAQAIIIGVLVTYMK